MQFIKGVGPKLGSVFVSRGIRTARDLLFFFPRTHEDRSKLLSVAEALASLSAEPGLEAAARPPSVTIALDVISSRRIPLRGRGRSMQEVRCSDATGSAVLKWFHFPKGMESRFAPGVRIIVTGSPKKVFQQLEFIHPEISFNGSPNTADYGRIVPVYVEIEGVPTRTLRRVLWNALEKFGSLLEDDIPQSLLARHGLPPLREAIQETHFPTSAEVSSQTRYMTRIIYDEFFKFEYQVLKQRLRMQREKSTAFDPERVKDHVENLKKLLPFRLTGDQEKSLGEILSDLAQSHPMQRLIQGDVGSGKTAVALLSAAAVLAEGGQAALMAPTEILAEQHFRSAIRLFGSRVRTALLTGSTTAAERRVILPRLEAGEPSLLIGTHALIEDAVRFKALDFVLIDEQHRFGVEQRRALRSKGHPDAAGRPLVPHLLVLTATPIPRTLALTAYGDLAVSTLKEMPPGRTPIRTRVVSEDKRSQAYAFIAEQLRAGRQAYFIFPLVSESEAEGFTELRSATAEAERLQSSVFPDFKVGLMHGQLLPAEKSEIMDRFKRGEIHLLVSTTVVEVGVDVPNATVMAIEHAERFGLSQLHQLRGRVGRGAHASYCFLFTANNRGKSTHLGENAALRLSTLEKTTDGFEIAEVDLKIRGPGEFLGTRQAGTLPFRVADLVRDRDWLYKAREDALAILKSDPELEQPETSRLRRYDQREGRVQAERLSTS